MFARQSIKIAVAWFNLKTILDILTLKLKGGISVEIILHYDDINNGGKNSLDFSSYKRSGGVLIWAHSNNSTMHQKFCIIDEETVITGSFNWTNRAENRNDEDILVHKDDTELVRDFLCRFNELKTKYTIITPLNSIGYNNISNVSHRSTLMEKGLIENKKGITTQDGVLSVPSYSILDKENGLKKGAKVPYSNLKDANFSVWIPDVASDTRIQPIPDSEYKKKFVAIINGRSEVCHGYDVRYYHTDNFYSRLEDIPDTLSARGLIAVSSYASKFVNTSIMDSSINTIAELRRACISKKKTVLDNPINFEFSKYGVIYRENPKDRKLAKFKGLPIGIIMDIVKWIFEDFTIPISSHYYHRRLNSSVFKYINRLKQSEKESFYSILDLESYHVHFDNHTTVYNSIEKIAGDSLSRTINDIYFIGYNAYKHKLEWQQHTELKTLGDYINFLKEKRIYSDYR